MSSNEQRREAAKRKLQRQQERRAEQAERRKRVAVITAVGVVVVVVAAVVALSALGGGEPATEAQPAGAAQPAAAPTPAPASLCTFEPTGEPPARPVSTPENTNPPTQGTVNVTLATTQGPIPITLDRSAAPCTVASFLHLARSDFYDSSPCHRLVTQGALKVLQCGDPTGTGTGGPGYSVPDEKPTALAPAPASSPAQEVSIYPRGAVAMANSGTPDSGGSQFFLVYADSQLPPDYTVFGTVAEPGLAVLEKIAQAGSDGSLNPSPGGGRPNLPVTISDVAVPAP